MLLALKTFQMKKKTKGKMAYSYIGFSQVVYQFSYIKIFVHEIHPSNMYDTEHLSVPRSVDIIFFSIYKQHHIQFFEVMFAHNIRISKSKNLEKIFHSMVFDQQPDSNANTELICLHKHTQKTHIYFFMLLKHGQCY